MSNSARWGACSSARFSALQRAENSSIAAQQQRLVGVQRPFQCSSASRKFLNRAAGAGGYARHIVRFSALQRAENSSIAVAGQVERWTFQFQCSSASRKFLNRKSPNDPPSSAAFQCSSASRKFLNVFDRAQIVDNVSVGFSALQRAENSSIELLIGSHLPEPDVSVLFSEPKIPQFVCVRYCRATRRRQSFSALQRAENSSMVRWLPQPSSFSRVSVLFSEPKIPQSSTPVRRSLMFSVSVLFSEPKIPQFKTVTLGDTLSDGFSALQRAENSSIHPTRVVKPAKSRFSALQRAENSSMRVL